TLYRQKKFDVAGQTYRQALAELSDSSHMGGIAENRSHYRAYHIAYYKEYVDLLVQLGQRELAFEVVEGSRAHTLFEMLDQSQIDIHQGVDSNLLSRERDLNQALNAKSQYRIRLLSE